MYPAPQRPIGISLLSVLFVWIGGLGTLVFPLFLLFGISGQLADLVESSLIHSRSLSVALTTLLLITWYAGYILYLCLGIGLWKLRRWALKGIIILQWVFLALGAVMALAFVRLQPLVAVGTGVFLCGIYGALLWYLKRPGVQWPFEATFAADHGLPVPPQPISSTPMWKMVVAGCGAGVAICAIFGVSLFYGVEQMMRTSTPYKLAVKQAQESPCLRAKLGRPIVVSGSASGSIEDGSEGTAELDIPISGSRAGGVLHVEAKGSDGVWTFQDLTLEDSNGQTHILPTPSPCP